MAKPAAAVARVAVIVVRLNAGCGEERVERLTA